MNRLPIILITFFCMLSAFQSADIKSSTDVNKKIFLDINSNGKRVEVKVGDEIRIELQGIGSTGYSWHFDQLDLGLFAIIHEERREIKKEIKDLTGGSLVYIWTLKPRRPGISVIRMEYYRIWEGKEKAIQRFEVKVNIQE